MSLLNEMLLDLDQRNVNRDVPFDVAMDEIASSDSKINMPFLFACALLGISLFLLYSNFFPGREAKKEGTQAAELSLVQNVSHEAVLPTAKNKEVESENILKPLPVEDISEPTMPVVTEVLEGKEKKIQDVREVATKKSGATNTSGTVRHEVATDKVRFSGGDTAQSQEEQLAEQLAELPASAAGKKPVVSLAEESINDVLNESEGESGMRIALSLETLDRQTADKARVLRKKSRDMDAQALLQNQLAQYPESLLCVQLLADLYFDTGKRNALATFAAEHPFVDPSLRAYVLARLYTLDGQVSIALSLLNKPFQQNTVHSDVEEPYLALMAALYQQASSFAEAETLYLQLVRTQPEGVRHWLGLALASDAQNKSSQALQAYKKVQQLGVPSDRVAAYINKRIDLLAARQNQNTQGS